MWWVVVCEPILVFSLSLGQAEQLSYNLGVTEDARTHGVVEGMAGGRQSSQ